MWRGARGARGRGATGVGRNSRWVKRRWVKRRWVGEISVGHAPVEHAAAREGEHPEAGRAALVCPGPLGITRRGGRDLEGAQRGVVEAAVEAAAIARERAAQQQRSVGGGVGSVRLRCAAGTGASGENGIAKM
jgi:hypothetical protein